MRWNGRRLYRDFDQPKRVITPPFIRFTQMNQPKDTHCFAFNRSLWHIPVSRLVSHIHKLCYRNLPETQTQQNAGNFLDKYFVILFTMQHRFISGCNRIQIPVRCSCSLRWMLQYLPCKSERRQWAHMLVEHCRLHVRTITHSLKWRRRRCQHKRTRCLCSQQTLFPKHCWLQLTLEMSLSLRKGIPVWPPSVAIIHLQLFPVELCALRTTTRTQITSLKHASRMWTLTFQPVQDK